MRDHITNRNDAINALDTLRAWHTNRLMPTGEQVRALRAIIDAYICDDPASQWELDRAHEAIAAYRARP